MIMQKLLTTLFTLFFFTLTTTAQTGWQWGKRGGSSSSGSFVKQEGDMEMTTDQNGNLYVLALVSKGMPALIDTSNSPNSDNQLSLTKWGCDGLHQWTKYFGSPVAFIAVSSALGIDSLGGIYFTGITGESGYFDTDTTLPISDPRIFYIVKYDTAGNFQWLRMPQADTVSSGLSGTASKSRAIGLDVAPNGDIFILSYLSPGIFGGTYAITTGGFHLLKYNKDGELISGKEVDMAVSSDATGAQLLNLTAETTGFARDHNSGNFYISGVYYPDYGTLTFGSTSLISGGGVGAIPMYLTAFDSDGHHLWTEQTDPSMGVNAMYSRPRIDEFGNIYVGGESEPGNTFLGHTFYNNVQAFRPAQFIISVQDNGSLNWVANMESVSADLGGLAYKNGIISAGGAWGQTLVYGTDTLTAPLGEGKSFLLASNGFTGNLVRSIDTFGWTGVGFVVTDMTSDRKSSIYMGGGFPSEVFLPGTTLTNTAGGTSRDFFVVKYGPDDCDCNLAIPDFTYSSAAGSHTVNFTYTGSSGIDSVRWEFGDGTRFSGLTAEHTYATAGTYGVSIVVYNHCGIIVYYKEVTTGTTGVDNVDFASSVSIYPNPATGSIIIEGAGIGTALELYNTIGQRVLRTIITQEIQAVNLSGISEGMYILYFTTREGNSGSVKMVKQ